jgi:hypothetical protein
MNEELNVLSTSQWWHKRRFQYNVSLICAGILAFISYATVIFKNGDIIPDTEITVFTTLFQGIGYLIMMGVANICFYAGPISERLIKPKDVQRFRIITYRFGYWFSVLLPFSIPGILLYLVTFHKDYWIN